MKIRQVDVYRLRPALADRPFPVRPVALRITAQDGLVGYGEAGIAAGIGAGAVFGMLEEMAQALFGLGDVTPNAVRRHFMTTAYGHISGGGAVFFSALSAIDLALWDLMGKALGVPCSELLGGRIRNEVACYASQVHDGWGDLKRRFSSAEDFAQGAQIVRGEGFRAAKFNFHAVDRQGNPISADDTGNPAHAQAIGALVEERLAAVRQAAGDDFGIISESLSRLCPACAWQVDRAAEKYGVLYLEEPYFSWDPRQYEHTASQFKTPLACGEKLHGRHDFLPYFLSRSIQVAQMDVSMCGGLSEAKKIADMAEAFGVSVQPHICGTPLTEAATLQLEAVLPNFVLHERLLTAQEKEVQALCTQRLALDHGCIRVPDAPGLGQEFSEQALRDAVAHVTVKGELQ